MDLATLIGLVGAIGIIVVTIALGGAAMVFINVPSLLIVLIGTFLVVMIKFSLKQFLSAGVVAIKAFIHKATDPQELIEKSVELAQMSRQGGLLSLESAEVPDDFMQFGIGMIVDGHEPEMIKSVLMKDLNLTLGRHSTGQKIFKAIGDVGPAMGMIGTLIGLVQMLSVMDDPKAIGPAMAVALLTTLYGAILANVIAIPVADKLALRSTEERRSKSLIIDALMAILEGQNPRVLESMLQNYLPRSKRAGAGEEAAAAG
ncbi:MAG: flagellar motor protein PomA [Gammaproteobacteria bacterium]|nr:flagellar motor protein PomA [Gammaproteobacteria bacterium]NND59473.1 flagellar motor protein PomA [Gammaproteobacteria bacterium]